MTGLSCLDLKHKGSFSSKVYWYIGILIYGHSLASETFPKCAQFQCIKLTADHDITFIFLPKKAKEQPTACSTHISQQAKSSPTSWQVHHTAGYLQAVIEKDGKTHKMDNL